MRPLQTLPGGGRYGSADALAGTTRQASRARARRRIITSTVSAGGLSRSRPRRAARSRSRPRGRGRRGWRAARARAPCAGRGAGAGGVAAPRDGRGERGHDVGVQARPLALGGAGELGVQAARHADEQLAAVARRRAGGRDVAAVRLRLAEPALDGGVRGRRGVLRRRAVGLAAGELLDRGRPDGAVAVGGVREDHRVIGGLRHEPNLRLRRRTGNRSVVQRGAEALERPAQEARDVDLREADVRGDPALAAAAVEPEDDDPALVQRQRAEGGGDRDPLLGARDRVGERGVVLRDRREPAGAGRPGARMTPPRSRRWLRISPVIVGTAKASNAPRPGSKRSTAWISPMQPAWTRSSSGSPPRRAKRSASARTSGRLASIRRRRSGVSRTCPIGRPTFSPKFTRCNR